MTSSTFLAVANLFGLSSLADDDVEDVEVDGDADDVTAKGVSLPCFCWWRAKISRAKVSKAAICCKASALTSVRTRALALQVDPELELELELFLELAVDPDDSEQVTELHTLLPTLFVVLLNEEVDAHELPSELLATKGLFFFASFSLLLCGRVFEWSCWLL